MQMNIIQHLQLITTKLERWKWSCCAHLIFTVGILKQTFYHTAYKITCFCICNISNRKQCFIKRKKLKILKKNSKWFHWPNFWSNLGCISVFIYIERNLWYSVQFNSRPTHVLNLGLVSPRIHYNKKHPTSQSVICSRNSISYVIYYYRKI